MEAQKYLENVIASKFFLLFFDENLIIEIKYQPLRRVLLMSYALVFMISLVQRFRGNMHHK